MTIKIYNQSVFDQWPIESESCQSVITSPPYYRLRKYDIPNVFIGGDKICKHEFESSEMKLLYENKQGVSSKSVSGNKDLHGMKSTECKFCTKCDCWEGQYGLEDTSELFVSHTLLWAEEAYRVLKNDGILFINFGDSYNGSGKGTSTSEIQSNNKGSGIDIPTKIKSYPDKCQLLIPHRVVIALIESGKWILRNTIIWYSPNKMPESAKNRFSKKYEYIFMLTKNDKYYFNLDAVRTPHKDVSIKRLKRAVGNKNKWLNMQGLNYQRKNYKDRIGSMQSNEFDNGDYLVGNLNSLGANPGDVWNPSEDDPQSDFWNIPIFGSSENHFAVWNEKLVSRMIRCSTKEGDTVLDPFCGSGTTLRVAESLNRNSIGIDLGYQEIQKRKTSKIQKKLFV